jgi:hypothetical protein
MRRVALSVLIAILALLAAGWMVLGLQARRLGEGLVADANALEARRFGLASDLAAGNLMDCLGAAADVSPDLSQSLPWTSPQVIAATAGSTPLSETLRAEVARHRPWLAGLLTCASLPTVAPASGVGPFPDALHVRRQTLPRAMEALTSLAPLSMRDDLARSDGADAALVTCGAVLSLTTAWLRLEGLESMLPTLGPSRAVMAPCAEAKRRATDDARDRFVTRVDELQRLAPRYSEVMSLERTQIGLRLFGAWLPTELDAQLPPSARLVTRRQRDGRFDRGVLATLMLRLYWKRFDAGMREAERASLLEPAARETAILAAQARLEAPWLKRFFPADPVDLRYQMYAVYLDQLHAQLEVLAR